MVRTYAFNASSRSEIFEQYKHTVNNPTRYQNDSTSRSQDSGYSNTTADSSGYENRHILPSDSQSVTSSTISNSNTHPTIPNSENNNQFSSPFFPPLNQSNIYQSSFHSSMMDPVGSIVGLRLVYMNGQLAYVPVEPHINMMINKQFGGPLLPQIQPNVPVLAQNAMTHSISNQFSQSKQDVNENRQEPPQQPYQQVPARQSANQQYRNNAMLAKFGSLPNLGPGSKQFASAQEQHKFELAQQIEDNKRRREMEKQKELEMEKREIRKWEEYQKRIREEDEREKRQILEKAKAMEMRNQQVYARQQNPPQNRQRQVQEQVQERRPPPRQQQQQYHDYPEDEEPIRPMKNSNSYSDYPPEDQWEEVPNPRNQNPPRQRKYEPPQQQQREPRPDSSQPRQVEWWEKKASWQEKADRNQSAVIPTLRGKPPAIPDSQRSGYDSGNVGEHQSRPNSRTAASTQRSSEEPEEEEEKMVPAPRTPSGARRAPEAFTISG